MGTTTVTDATFATEVLKSDKPVLVDFWAEWCAPCRKISPILEEIATEMADRIKVVKINADENPQTVRAYQVMSLPTLTIFRSGEPVKSVIGAKPKSELVRHIESALE